MTDQGTVTIARSDRAGGEVARLTLSRPAKRNALTPRMIADLAEAAGTLATLPDLRAVVIAGADGAFCAGADLATLAGLTPETARSFITALHRAIDAVRRLPVPVIAELEGPCLGAGMELAAACDLRLADATLTAGMPEVRIGVPSVIEASLLPRLIGWGRTGELVLTGHTIDADEAQRIGFVERLTQTGRAREGIDILLGRIIAAGPRAVRAQKAVMRGWERDETEGRAASIDAFAESFRSDEPRRLLARVIGA